MENEGKKSYVGLITSIIGILLLTFIVMVAVNFSGWGDKLTNVFSDTEQIAQQPADTIVTPTVTVEDIITMREQEREFRYLDSVYMNMPEIALIAILIKGGVDMSHTDIAQEYIQNRKTYNDVQFGAQINDLYQHANNQEPDTIPKQPKVDVPVAIRE